MEIGEHNPSMETLIKVASGLDIELMIDIRPKGKAAKLPKKLVSAGSFASGGCEIVLASARATALGLGDTAPAGSFDHQDG